jgi:hypothetical protein
MERRHVLIVSLAPRAIWRHYIDDSRSSEMFQSGAHTVRCLDGQSRKRNTRWKANDGCWCRGCQVLTNNPDVAVQRETEARGAYQQRQHSSSVHGSLNSEEAETRGYVQTEGCCQNQHEQHESPAFSPRLGPWHLGRPLRSPIHLHSRQWLAGTTAAILADLCITAAAALGARPAQRGGAARVVIAGSRFPPIRVTARLLAAVGR